MENFNLHFDKSEMEYFKRKGVVEYLESRKRTFTNCYNEASTKTQKEIFKQKLEDVEFELKFEYPRLEYWKNICREYEENKFKELELLAEQNPRWGSNSWDL